MKIRLILLGLLFFSIQAVANNSSENFWTEKWVEYSKGHNTVEGDYQNKLNNTNWHYKNRKLLHESAQDYMVNFETQNTFFIDPELEDYLYQLIYQIHPNEFPSQQKVHLNIKIIKSVIPETFSFANGTIIISTGMLSLLHSEDELMAVLTKEIAHITLDHNVETYTALKTKQTISSIIGAGMYITSTAHALNKGDNFWEADYLGSAVGVGSELLSYGILSTLGVGYNRSRIYDADEIAQDWMIQNKRDPYALLQVLRRLQFYDLKYRGTSFTIDKQRLFFNIRYNNLLKIKSSKLKPTGTKLVTINKEYDTHISECLKANSKLYVAEELYSEAIPYLNRSIQSDWASGESYLLKAIALRHIKYSDTNNQEILSLLSKSKENSVINLPWACSEEGLIYLRLKEYNKALKAFQEFEAFFSEEQSETAFWARKMIAKLNKKVNL